MGCEWILVSSAPLWFCEGYGRKLVTLENTKSLKIQRLKNKETGRQRRKELAKLEEGPQSYPSEKQPERKVGNEVLS